MARRPSLVPLCAAALLLPCLPVRAAEARWGVQAGFALPQGDLGSHRDHKGGYGLGGFLDLGLGGGHGLRPRLDVTFFPSTSHLGFTDKLTDYSLGLDYSYHLAGRPQGWYLAAGLAFHVQKVEQGIPAVGSYPAWVSSDQRNRAGTAVALGYDFSPQLGCELRMVSTLDTGGDHATLLQRTSFVTVGVTYRF